MLRSNPLRIGLVVAAVLGGVTVVVLATRTERAAAHAPRCAGTCPATTSTGTSTPAPQHQHVRTHPGLADLARRDDGSLGSQATRLACRLLTSAEVASQFGRPVGPATATWPYCQWLVGANAFVALDVLEHTSFASATRYVDTLQTVAGLGQQAIIANNRYLYFTQGSTSYWLLYQTPGDFTALNAAQLVALGHDVLDHTAPAGHLAPTRPPRRGPPIYFAGDSTAAGPQWAWWAYHENATTTRTLAEYQVGSGLVVPGYFDWPRHLLAEAKARRPKLVIFMGSANDNQDLLVHGAYQPVGSAGWDAAYGRLVGATMRSLVREGCKVLWIGEPAMQSPSLNAAMQTIDGIDAAQAAKVHGAVFFNPGAVLNGPDGAYAGSLVIDGQLTPVRLDGVHLNQAGSVVLADAIAREVAAILHVTVPS